MLTGTSLFFIDHTLESRGVNTCKTIMGEELKFSTPLVKYKNNFPHYSMLPTNLQNKLVVDTVLMRLHVC